MWQSKSWNGQHATFRMFCVLGVTLVCLTPRKPAFAAGQER